MDKILKIMKDAEKERHSNLSEANQYKLSRGNLKVLETIPVMMLQKEWRDKLRVLVFDFLFGLKK